MLKLKPPHSRRRLKKSIVQATSNQLHHTVKACLNYFYTEYIDECDKHGLQLPAMYNHFLSLSPTL